MLQSGKLQSYLQTLDLAGKPTSDKHASLLHATAKIIYPRPANSKSGRLQLLEKMLMMNKCDYSNNLLVKEF